MNRGRFIWGIVCLALAVFLAVLYFALPEVEVVFKLGDINLSFIPILILGAVGILLLAIARR